MRLLSEKRIDDLLIYIKGITELAEDEVEKKKLKELHKYFHSNKEGLIPYQERGLKFPIPPEGVEYRNLGTMEHHVCDGAARRINTKRRVGANRELQIWDRYCVKKYAENFMRP